jgi:hypothetical protein
LRRADATLVRGSIDCLLQLASGEVRVVEFKTGRASPVHQRQLDIYVEAARALFPDVPVEGIVIHA